MSCGIGHLKQSQTDVTLLDTNPLPSGVGIPAPKKTLNFAKNFEYRTNDRGELKNNLQAQ